MTSCLPIYQYCSSTLTWQKFMQSARTFFILTTEEPKLKVIQTITSKLNDCKNSMSLFRHKHHQDSWIFNIICVSLAVQSAVSASLLKHPCNTNITTAKVMFSQVWIWQQDTREVLKYVWELQELPKTGEKKYAILAASFLPLWPSNSALRNGYHILFPLPVSSLLLATIHP